MLFRKEYKKRNVLFTFHILFGLVLLMAFLSPGSSKVQTHHLQPISTGWEYQVTEEACKLQVSRLVSDEMIGKTIMFYTYDSFVDAYIDGKHVYHFGTKPPVGRSPGSYYHFIEIPRQSAGRMLTIDIETVYPHKFQSAYPMYIGNAGEIVWNLFQSEMFSFITNIIMLIFGVIMCLLHFVGSRAMLRRGSNFYLGLMTITYVVWSTMSMFVSQLIFHNAIFQYYLTYFSLYILTMLFILYIESISGKMHCRVEFVFCTLIICICCICHFGGVYDFTELTRFFSITVAGTLVYLMARVLKYQRKNPMLRMGLLILCIFALLNFLEYVFMDTLGHHSRFMRIGLLLYMIYSIYIGAHQMLQEMAMVKETTLLKTIAYTDNLTKIGNRYAFERDLHKIKLQNLSMVSFDLNNLKCCNDEHGHACGDQYIKSASQILRDVYGESVYRIGGDEFAALLENISRGELEEKRMYMEAQIKAYNAKSENEIKLEIASGHSSYHDGDVSYEDILKRADAKMYENKKYMKREM